MDRPFRRRDDPTMAPGARRIESTRSGATRVSGLAVLLAIVATGLVTGVGFYRLKRGEANARVAAQLAAAPRTSEERLDLWLALTGPQLHHRLAVVGRFTPEMPWLVTHAVAAEDGGPPELWGIECATLPKALGVREGLRIVMTLPAPQLLGRATFEGEHSERVPLFARGVAVDASDRLRTLALHLLEGLPKALERDVPGATLELRVLPP
jgi:hypothetical protein